MTLPQNIIIVEDEVITQRYLQDIFAQHNMHMSGCFNSAEETMKHLKDLNCDMLLMDINIKGPVDGIQLAREILKSYTIPIVFITAHNDNETLEEILELAPYGFIAKPFSSKDVIVALQIAYKRYLTDTSVCHLKDKEYIDNIPINKVYSYSTKQSTLYNEGIMVKLNQKQSTLLSILVDNINHAVSYYELVSRIWDDAEISDSALRTLVYSIRKILPDIPIVSHSKMGYMLQSVKNEGIA
jgi:DNA-binding response OmpR family regulator